MKILNVKNKTTNIRSWLTALICCLGLCLSCQDNKESDAAEEPESSEETPDAQETADIEAVEAEKAVAEELETEQEAVQ